MFPPACPGNLAHLLGSLVSQNRVRERLWGVGTEGRLKRAARRERLTQTPSPVFPVTRMPPVRRVYLRRGPPELSPPLSVAPQTRRTLGRKPGRQVLPKTGLGRDGNLPLPRSRDCLSVPRGDGSLRRGGPAPFPLPASRTTAGEPRCSEAPPLQPGCVPMDVSEAPPAPPREAGSGPCTASSCRSGARAHPRRWSRFSRGRSSCSRRRPPRRRSRERHRTCRPWGRR